MRVPGAALLAVGAFLLLRRARPSSADVDDADRPVDIPADTVDVDEAPDMFSSDVVPLRRRLKLATPLLLLSIAVILCSVQGSWQPVLCILLAASFLLFQKVDVYPRCPPAQRTVSYTAAKFEGTWIKDPVLSESMEDALQLLQLNGLVRTAIRLIRGVRLRVTEEEFEFVVFSVIPWFKVVERYPWTGATSLHKRRDLRRGKHRGRVRLHDGHVLLLLEWEDPFGGVNEDDFYLVKDNELHVSTTITIGDHTVKYIQVYTRKEK